MGTRNQKGQLLQSPTLALSGLLLRQPGLDPAWELVQQSGLVQVLQADSPLSHTGNLVASPLDSGYPFLSPMSLPEVTKESCKRKWFMCDLTRLE